MLERTAGCLETGSLRRLVPGSNNPLKSRRTLHSGFWTHGATDLELSPLWTALIRGPDPLDTTRESQQQKTLSGRGGMLLDFLYPVGTIRFLRQYSGWGADRQDGRQSIAGLSKLGHRLYTSSAKDVAAAEKDATSATAAHEQTGLERKTLLRKSLGLTATTNFEEAWRLYSEREKSDQDHLRLPLLEYLLPSNRVIDAERTTELFVQLDENDRTRSAYKATIKAFLRLQNVSDAVNWNDAALAKFNVPVGLNDIMAYTIDHSLWSQALKTWEKYRSYTSQFPEAPYDILDQVFKLPNLVPRTFSLADHITTKISSVAQPPLDGSSGGLLDVAAEIVMHVLTTDAASDPITLTKLIAILETWGLDVPGVYQSGVLRLLQKQKDKKPAVRLYREARAKNKDVKYSTYVLHHLLAIFCKHHSVLGMQQILDDFFRYYGKPSRRAYHLCMKEFASQGDAETVHKLFEQFSLRFGSGDGLRLTADEFAPLLHVHAKRGEVSAVLAAFESIQGRFNLQPTILCYNIVLNAYCKVRDADAAVEFFNRILAADALQPDDYTFGTMIGLCSMMGDRVQATELYNLAQNLGIKLTISMVDPLVLAHLKDEDLSGAEKICTNNLNSDVEGSRTRMWNYLLLAHAMRRDLVNVNRLLRQMTEAKIDYDHFTYAALMQALVMIKQPESARSIMDKVMPEAGLKPTNFHYAVLMGGYLATGDSRKVFNVQSRMLRKGVMNTASTRFVTMKAAAREDDRLIEYGTKEQQYQRAFEIFQETISAMNSMDIAQSAKKGAGNLPQDIAYSSMFHSFIMFVLSQRNDHDSVAAIYEEYLQTLPESQRASPPIRVLTPLLITRMRTQDYVGAQECWDLALSQARKYGRGVPPVMALRKASTNVNQSTTKEPTKFSMIVTDHQLDLCAILSQHLISLVHQHRDGEIPQLVDDLLADGFLLSNNNWNHYIEIMARRYHYKLAFELCEQRLMPGWSGWARVRWQALERNRLSTELRSLKKRRKFLRPLSKTLLYLARVYLELQTLAAESPAQQILLAELERSCPLTVNAIRTMQRSDDELERRILRDFIV